MYLPYYIIRVCIFVKNQVVRIRRLASTRFIIDYIEYLLYNIIYLNLQIVHYQGEKDKKKEENFGGYVKNTKK